MNNNETLVDCGPITDDSIDSKYTGTRYITKDGKWIIPPPPPQTTWRSQSIEQTNQILNTGQNTDVKEITTIKEKYMNYEEKDNRIVYLLVCIYLIYLFYYIMKNKR